MEKLSTTLILIFLVSNAISTLPTALGVDKRPEAIQTWFKNLPRAKQKLAHLHFYFHDTVSGPNPTAVTIAQASITRSNPMNFGLVRMMDNPLTVGPELKFGTIGRTQGIYGGASLETVDLLMTLNYVFTEGKYNGPKFELGGQIKNRHLSIYVLAHNPIFDRYREMPIVGGTGFFRLARGIATEQTASLPGQDAVVEYDVVVLYYV